MTTTVTATGSPQTLAPVASYRSRVVESDYYSIGRVPTVERQEAVGWQARADAVPWPIPEPLDWHANPYNDRNWFAQFHGWRHMDPYLRAYKNTTDCVHLRRIVPWMTTWPAFRDSAPEHERRYLATLAGMRATRLAILIDAHRCGAVALSEDERETLYGLARDDAGWLATPDQVALMNHAYYQVFGLELLSRVLSEEPWAPRAREMATETFNRLVRAQFTDEGVHVENSPCYHYYALEQIRRSGAIDTLASADTRALLEQAAAVLPWLVFPDGNYADIGDSAGSSVPLVDPGACVARIRDRTYAVAPFWRSGYGIVRSLPDVPLERASMLFLVGASHSHTHSHADKLSFELMEFGRRLIVDTGKYGYKRDAMRSYVESAAAHNTVGLATNPIRRVDVTLGATRLSAPVVAHGGFSLGGDAVWSTRWYAFTHRRDLVYRPAEYLVIRDTLSSEQAQQYVSRLHFDRSLELQPAEHGFIACFDGHTMRVELLDTDGELAKHHGEENPLRGWQSVGYLQMEPTTMIEALCPGKERTITWRITFG